jgi:hypothetical protein
MRTDEELAACYGISAKQVQQLRQELKDGSPRVDRLKEEFGRDLAILADPSDEALARFRETSTGRAFREALAPDPPPVSEETVTRALERIKEIRDGRDG